MELIFLRHLKPDVAPGMCYGAADVPLAAGWEDKIPDIAEKIFDISKIYTSPLQRCAKISDALVGALEVSQTVDERLRELDLGRWEMTLWDDIPRAEIDAWGADLLYYREHGGESVASMRRRVMGVISEADEGTAFVTHAGVIRAALDISGHDDPWGVTPEFGEVLRINF